MRVGKVSTGTVPDDDEVERRNDVKPLVIRSDAGDKVARSVAAEAGVLPILARPVGLQHFLEVELPAVRRGAIVPPAQREGAVGWRAAPRLSEGFRPDDRLAFIEHELPHLRPLPGGEDKAGRE